MHAIYKKYVCLVNVDEYFCTLPVLQDSMVICRLKKNSEFRQNDATNRTSSSQPQLSTMHNTDCAVSEAGADQGDKTVECLSKKCSSSYDSYSIEQIDSTSESNQKFAVEVTQPESSGHEKVHFIYLFIYFSLDYPFVFLFYISFSNSSSPHFHFIGF